MQGVRSFARTALLAGSLALGGNAYCDGRLPVEDVPRIAQMILTAKERELSEQKQKEAQDKEAERKVYEPVIAKVHYDLAQTENLFNDYLKDGNLTKKEQMTISDRLVKTKYELSRFLAINAKNTDFGQKSQYAEVHSEARGKGYTDVYVIKDERLNFPDKDSRLLSLLDLNLYWNDTGKPELEKELDKDFSKYGAHINVERTTSPLEYGVLGIGALVALRKLRKLGRKE